MLIEIYDKRRTDSTFIASVKMYDISRRQAKLLLKQRFGRHCVFTFLEEDGEKNEIAKNMQV